MHDLSNASESDNSSHSYRSQKLNHSQAGLSIHGLFSSPKSLGLKLEPVRNTAVLPFIRCKELQHLTNKKFEAGGSSLESLSKDIFLEILKYLLDDPNILINIASTSRSMLSQIMESHFDDGIPPQKYYPLLQKIFEEYAVNHYSKLFFIRGEFVDLMINLASGQINHQSILEVSGKVSEQDVHDYVLSRQSQYHRYKKAALGMALICAVPAIIGLVYAGLSGNDNEDQPWSILAFLLTGIALSLALTCGLAGTFLTREFFSRCLQKGEQDRIQNLKTTISGAQIVDADESNYTETDRLLVGV